jgi:hypothetical protein
MNGVIAVWTAATATTGVILRIGEIAVREAVRRRVTGRPAGTAAAAGRGRTALSAGGQDGTVVDAAAVASKVGRE